MVKIALKVNFPHGLVVKLIKKWKDTGSITLKKVLEGLKSLQNQLSIAFFKVLKKKKKKTQKTCDLISKELANKDEAKTFF